MQEFSNLPNYAVNLLSLRYKNNLTQQHLAKIIGTSQNRICKFENGKVKITPDLAKKLAKVLNVSYTKFL